MGGERKADDISNLYPLQYQPNYKVPTVRAAEERPRKIPQTMSGLVMLITVMALQSPISLKDTSMRAMATNQQPHPSRWRNGRRKMK